MAKKATVTASISTNPTFSERYFVDVRDVTNGRNRQMTTRHLDAQDIPNFLTKIYEAADKNGVEVEFIDETDELSFIPE